MQGYFQKVLRGCSLSAIFPVGVDVSAQLHLLATIINLRPKMFPSLKYVPALPLLLKQRNTGGVS